MATFKVGQRVRIVVADNQLGAELNGTETTITGSLSPSMFGDRWGTAATDGDTRFAGVLERCLRPLTDPKAEEFIERIKKLGREPVGHKETVEERK